MLMTLMPRPRYRTMRGLGVTAGDEAPLEIVKSGTESTFTVENVIAGAKMWLSPSTAVAEIKAVASGSSTTAAAKLVGLAAVPILAALVVPSFLKSGRRRR